MTTKSFSLDDIIKRFIDDDCNPKYAKMLVEEIWNSTVSRQFSILNGLLSCEFTPEEAIYFSRKAYQIAIDDLNNKIKTAKEIIEEY